MNSNDCLSNRCFFVFQALLMYLLRNLNRFYVDLCSQKFNLFFFNCLYALTHIFII